MLAREDERDRENAPGLPPWARSNNMQRAQRKKTPHRTHTQTNKQTSASTTQNVHYEKSLISTYGLVDNYRISRSGGLGEKLNPD